ncbi:MAG: AraC family transcriptional regulator [Bacteroidota bacterium]
MDQLFRQQIETQQRGVMVERKAMLSASNIELHFYETIAKAEAVKLTFDHPVIAVMLKGKKIVEMEDTGRFGYDPGESLIVPAEKTMSIDFPEATPDNPTQCLAFMPDECIVGEAVHDFYQKTNATDVDMQYEVDFSTELLFRDQAILKSVEHLVFLFGERNEHSDLFIHMATKELVIRLLQSKARKLFLHSFQKEANRMAHIARYIKKNLGRSISIKQLAEEAHMSKSNFFVLFKNTFGITPNEYIIQEKIKEAKRLIRLSPHQSISQIAYQLGYSDSSYFAKQFKGITGLSPRQFERQIKS